MPFFSSSNSSSEFFLFQTLNPTTPKIMSTASAKPVNALAIAAKSTIMAAAIGIFSFNTSELNSSAFMLRKLVFEVIK